MEFKDQQLLVAYSCQMKYLRRNNPLVQEEGSEILKQIKDHKEPTIKTSELLNNLMLVFKEHNGVHFENSRSVFGFDSYYSIKGDEINGTNRYCLKPLAGRIGIDFVVQNFGNHEWKPTTFGGDNAALFFHDIYIYGDGPVFRAIFHRVGNLSCKTIFMNAVNKIYKEQGIHLEMNPIFSSNDRITENQVDIAELNLVTTSSVPRNDLADTEKKGNKIERVKESQVSLYLNSPKYSSIKSKLMEFKKKLLGKPDGEKAIVQLKQEINSGLGGKELDYTEAFFRVYIGSERKLRTISLDEFIDLTFSRDITSKLEYGQDGRPTSESLLSLADQYYQDLLLETKK